MTRAEEARRLRLGADAEVEAGIRVATAAGVMARYRDEAHAATTARQAAEGTVDAIAAEIEARTAELGQAQAVLDYCRPVPVSTETVQALATPLVRMGAGADFDDAPLTLVERAMAGLWGRMARTFAIADFTYALDKAGEEKIREKIRAEYMNQPHLRQVGGGMLSATWVNPPKLAARPRAEW